MQNTATMTAFSSIALTAACIGLAVSAALPASAKEHQHKDAEIVHPIPTFTWPETARNAISITFDDARVSQVDDGMQVLDKHDVKATFYVVPLAVEKRLEGWKKAVKQGHEIGNHTTNHPCTGNFFWLQEKGISLESYTLDDIRKDITDANRYLKENLNVVPSSFAYPCGNTFVGRGADTASYVPVIAELFDSGRTWMDETANIAAFTDYSQLTGIRIDGTDFDELVKQLEYYRQHNTWIILAGHDIGEKGPYSTSTELLEKLLPYLTNPDNGYWLDTVDNVTQYVKKHRTPITD